MSTIYCDGFDTYTNLNERWTVLPSGPNYFKTVATVPRSGPYCLSLETYYNDQQFLRGLGAGAHATIIVHFAVRRTPSSSSNNRLMIALTSASGAINQTALAIQNNGGITLHRNNWNDVILGSVGSLLPVDTWSHIGWQCTLADTGATSRIWVDGNLVGNFSGLDTRQNSSYSVYDGITFMLGSPGTGVFWLLDDLVILNGAGASNNAYLGDCQVLPRLVTGAGDRTQLTPVGQPTNWQNVDEVRHDGTEYNQSAVAGNGDLYALQDVAAGSTIFAVQQVTYAGKDQPGTKSLAPLCKSAGTEYPQTVISLPVGIAANLNVYENDPATGGAWTPDGFNAAQFGAEVRA